MGESAILWVDGNETHDEVYAKVRSDLSSAACSSTVTSDAQRARPSTAAV